MSPLLPRAALSTILAVLAVLWPAPLVAGEAALPAPMDAPAFVRQLQALQARVGAASASEAAGIAASLPGAWRVRVGDYDYDVGAATLSASLRQAAAHPARWPAVRQTLVARIGTLRAHAAEASQAERGSHAGARRALEALLKEREFSRRADSGWLLRIGERVRAWLRSLFSRILPEGTTMRGAAEALAWLSGIAALVWLTVWLVRLRRSPRGAASLPHSDAVPRLSSRAWASLAQQAIERGDAREAVRCAYVAAIVRFEERGVWRVDETRTPREYERMLIAAGARREAEGPDAQLHSDLRAAFRDLARQFEQTWYGGRPADTTSLWQRMEQCGCSVPRQPAI